MLTKIGIGSAPVAGKAQSNRHKKNATPIINPHLAMASLDAVQGPSINEIVFTSSRKTKILTAGIRRSILRIKIFV